MIEVYRSLSSLTEKLILFLIVMGGLLLFGSIFSSGHASADCGIVGQTIDHYAGAIVKTEVIDRYGNPHYNATGNYVKVSEYGTGTSDDLGGNVVRLAPGGSTVISRHPSETFKQIGGCDGGSAAVIPGNGTNGSPDISSGYSDWGLDCDNSRLGNDSSGNPIFQRFIAQGVGTPSGFLGGGTWDYDISDSTGPHAAINGQTITFNIVYHEPIPPTPIPPSSVTACGSIQVYAGTTVIGSVTHYNYALVSLSGAALGSGTTYYPTDHASDAHPTVASDVNTRKPINILAANLTPNAQYVSYSADIYYNDIRGPHFIRTDSGTSPQCYQALCNIDRVDGNLPDGEVSPGATLTVHATVYNNSTGHWVGGVWTQFAIPSSDAGGYSLAMISNYGGLSGAFGVPSNGTTAVSFTVTAPSSGTTGTIQAGVGYNGEYWVSAPPPNGCNYSFQIYQPPIFNVVDALCQSTIDGWAFDPNYPNVSIEVEAYANGPKGTGTQLPGPDPGGRYRANSPTPAVPPSYVSAYGVTGNHGFNIPIPSAYQDGNDHNFYVYADDPSGIQNSGPITIGMTGCEHYVVTPSTNGAALLPDTESPTSFGSNNPDTSVTVKYDYGGGTPQTYFGTASTSYPSFPGVLEGINSPPLGLQTAYYYYTKNGSIVNPPSGNIPSPTGNFRYGVGNKPNPTVFQAPLLTIPASSYVVGDKYCLLVRVNPTDGFIQRDGTMLTQNDNPSTDTSPNGCDTVTNRPYFKVYNSGVEAGGAFNSGGNCTGSGILAGWNDDSGNYPPYTDFGAGSTLSNIATGQISGFASAQTPSTTTVYNRVGSDLSFANTPDPPIDKSGSDSGSSRSYTPHEGGLFGLGESGGGSYCLTDVSPPQGVSPTTGPVTINTTAVPDGHNTAIFVNGDVIIEGNITYPGSTGTWTIGATSNVPSMVVHATGNIYINNNVTELDGIYIAHGKIYTCNDDIHGNPRAPMPSADIFANCNKQLVVHGNFVASQTVLLRSLGTLRNEKPSAPTIGSAGQPGARAPLVWGSNGRPIPIGIGSCININEPSEVPSYTWDDNSNFLCKSSGSGVTIKWSHQGLSLAQTSSTPNCTNSWQSAIDSVFPGAEPGSSTWGDNFLCSNFNIFFKLGAPTAAESKLNYCTQITEPNDTHGSSFYPGGIWEDAWVCVQKYIATIPSTLASPAALPLTCDNNGSLTSNRPTCASEVFDFSPETYLSTPAIEPPNNGQPQWDSVTSLPPIL